MIAIGRPPLNWQRGTLQVMLAAGGLLWRSCSLSLPCFRLPGRARPGLHRRQAPVSVVSLGLLIWAFLPLMEDYPQAALVYSSSTWLADGSICCLCAVGTRNHNLPKDL
jgi:hypothetical protein